MLLSYELFIIFLSKLETLSSLKQCIQDIIISYHFFDRKILNSCMYFEGENRKCFFCLKNKCNPIQNSTVRNDN